MQLSTVAALLMTVSQLGLCLAPAVGGLPMAEHAAGTFAASGEPGPSASGVPVSPSEVAASVPDEGSGAIHPLPRSYPIDQATFDGLKARANAMAAGQPGEEAP
jgi:hypothetical protein